MANTVYFSGACISELGTVNGSAGDQTGKEIRTTEAYTHKLGWRIFRYPDTKVAYWIGTNAYNIADIALFGYGQNDRVTGYNACKKAGWEPKKVTIKVNLDCSEMARTCIACALEKDISDFNTASEPTVLLSLGFKEITGTALSNLKLGDIVVTPSKGHTEIVSKVVESVSTSSSTTSTTTSSTLTSGSRVTLSSTKIYRDTTSGTSIGTRSGVYYIYNATVVNGYVRMSKNNDGTDFWCKVSDLTTSATTTTSATSTSTTSTSTYKVKVLVDELNVRKGPGTSYAVATKVKKGDVYTIVQTSGDWGKLKSGAGWICVASSYCSKL